MRHSFALLCLIIGTAIFIWSGIHPTDRFTWYLEVAPIFIALPILLATYRRFTFTPLVYGLITLHAIILMVGGHYTYAEVPLFNLLRDHFHTIRNSYDGVGHLAQGFVPALVIRELLLRTSTLRAGKWMAALIIFGCLGISATYEIIEWLAAVWTGDNSAEAFLGTQGDPWDTQKDMALAGVGAALGLLTMSRWHNKQLLHTKG